MEKIYTQFTPTEIFEREINCIKGLIKNIDSDNSETINGNPVNIVVFDPSTNDLKITLLDGTEFTASLSSLADDQTITEFSLDQSTNILTIEIEDGNTKTVDLSSLKTPDYATEVSDGIVRLATVAEVIAGTDATKVITPATLQAKLDGQREVFTLTLGSDIGAVTYTHTLNTEDLDVEIIDATTKRNVEVEWKIIDSNNIEFNALGVDTDYKIKISY